MNKQTKFSKTKYLLNITLVKLLLYSPHVCTTAFKQTPYHIYLLNIMYNMYNHLILFIL